MILILIFELNYFVYMFYYSYWHFEWRDIASVFNIHYKSCISSRIFEIKPYWIELNWIIYYGGEANVNEIWVFKTGKPVKLFTLPGKVDESGNHQDRVKVELLLEVVPPCKWEWDAIWRYKKQSFVSVDQIGALILNGSLSKGPSAIRLDLIICYFIVKMVIHQGKAWLSITT